MSRPDLSTKPTLRGPRVLLRPFTADDVAAMAAILADPEVQRLTASVHSTAEAESGVPVADEAVRSWYTSRSSQPDRLDLAVVDRASGEVVGEVVLNEWDPGDRSGNFRALLGPAGRDRGLGTEAARLLLAHAFEEVGVHRVSLEVLADNARARRAYEKVGFAVEGVHREAFLFDGRWHDVVSMALLAGDWTRDPAPGGGPVAGRWTAYWTASPRRGELRSEEPRAPGPGEVLVRALHSGVSRGTEMLVHGGTVPPEVAGTMRAPFQDGSFYDDAGRPAAVKYGYLSVGVVEEGPAELVGQRVFCLHPHQDRYVVPAASVTAVPSGVPSERAVLTGAVETAVNALWDAAPRLGDRVAVIGAGMVGGTVAALLRRMPLGRLQLVDVDPARAPLAAALGVELVSPEAAAHDCDVVVHASATEAGLARGLQLLGREGELVEMSWYGTVAPRVPLGAEFHARRLSIRASQVSAVAPARAARRSTADRLTLAVEQLTDPAFDAFLTSRSPFATLPGTMEALYTGALRTLCHVVDYEGA